MSACRALVVANPLLNITNPKDGYTMHPVGFFEGKHYETVKKQFVHVAVRFDAERK